MRYSFNVKGERLVFAGAKDLNASYKDLAAVCDAIRYKPVPGAMALLDGVVDAGMPIAFRRNNKGMGSRHELHGRKGRYPKKCAMMVRKVLANAVATAAAKGYDESSLFVVHAAANKTQILRRNPPKGMLYHSDSYGFSAIRHSDIELSKVEIGLAVPEDVKLGKQALLLMKRNAAKDARRALKPDVAQQHKKPLPAKSAKPAVQKGKAPAAAAKTSTAADASKPKEAQAKA